jgi:hypothetical protein
VGTTKDHDEDEEAEKDVSLAVKIGAAIGGVVGLAIVVTLVIMWVLHRRNVAKYAKVGVGEMKPGGGVHAHHPSQEQHSHIMPPMMPGAHPAYEPMRNHHPQGHQSPWGGSPAISRDSSPHMHHAVYADHSPAASHHNIELTHMPPLANPQPFGQNHPR